ncbi:hypothetical protein TWF751_011571 [Orbilia oligospora]|nr:hypothetical protein TWF751_011571 [Orbilia oligospora]
MMVRLHTNSLPATALLSLVLSATFASCADAALKCSKNNTIRAIMSRSRTIAAFSPESHTSLLTMCSCLVSEGNKGASGANYAACQVDAALSSYAADQIAIACVCQPVDTISVSTTPTTTTTTATTSITCNRDNLFRNLLQVGIDAVSFCQSYTTVPATAGQAYPDYLTSYSETPSRISSACTCINLSSASSSSITTTFPTPTLRCVENNTIRQIMRVSRTIAAESSESVADLYNMCRCLVEQGNRGAAAEYDTCSISAGLSGYTLDQIATACVCQPVESIASVDTSTSVPASTPSIYNPPVPSSYDECVADPGNPDLVFNLYEPEYLRPLVRDGNYLKIATENPEDTDIHIPGFKFNGTPGVFPGTYVYDLLLGEEYVAVEDSGRVSFQTKSSGPAVYLTNNNATYITSIFSYSCDGALTIGVPGVIEYGFGFIDGYLYAQPIIPDFNNKLRMHRRFDPMSILKDFISFISSIPVVRSTSPVVIMVRWFNNPGTPCPLLEEIPRCPEGSSVTKDSSVQISNATIFDEHIRSHIINWSDWGGYSTLVNPFKNACDDQRDCFADCNKSYKDCQVEFCRRLNWECSYYLKPPRIMDICENIELLSPEYVSKAADLFKDINSKVCKCN